MVGTIPSTAFLLVKDNHVLGHFNSYFETACHLGISVDDDGVVTFMGVKTQPSYDMNVWYTKRDVIVDWAREHMCNKLPQNYVIYRYLTR